MTSERHTVRRRPALHRAVIVVNLVLSLSLISTGTVVLWAHAKVGQRQVVSIASASSTNAPADGIAESDTTPNSDLSPKNFLLTGSDNGACPESGDTTAGGIGDRTAFGERSDTIMLLRVDPRTNSVMVLSFPRDLWVDIAGTTRQARINSAFDSKDPSRLIRTIDQNFGVPVDHYVNVNLCAFKEIVDSVGGVKVPFLYRTRDDRSGFREVGPGCVQLRGSQALAYVRSRSGYRYFDESKQQWISDPTGDIGRINRQQDFLRRSMQRALDRVTNPATANSLLNVALSRVVTDDQLTPRDLLALAQAMRNLNTEGVNSFTIEWSMRRIGGESVLLPITTTESMQRILALFRGDAPNGEAPAATEDASNETSAARFSDVRGAALTFSPLLSIGLHLVESDDDSSTTSLPTGIPQQERLGVFPPDDPTCR